MLYRFKSQAAAEVVFLGETGEALLHMLGKTPAPRGVITVADLPDAIRTLRQAMQSRVTTAAATSDDTHPTGTHGDTADPPVRLQQRLPPMITLLQHSLAEQKDVVWGA
jgi:hypothetical protein